jgi:UDP-N-acetylglucosamine acyltransferase
MIHPTAVINKSAKIDFSVEIGPYTVVKDNVEIKKGCKIGAFCNIEGNTTIGENNQIFTGAIVGSIPQDLKYKGEKSYLIIGNNNIIREYVTINPGTGKGGKTIIGDNNLLMAYAHIAHDCIIGNNIIIANVGTLAGHVIIEDKAIIGGLAAVHQFVRVGKLSIIGGCSKVVQDIPPFSTCDGHPAKVRGINSVGLKRQNFNLKTRNALKKAFKILFHEGLPLNKAIKVVEESLPALPAIKYLLEFIRNTERGICL